jgi:diguanylate cyclase (GGDEF)-like protein
MSLPPDESAHALESSPAIDSTVDRDLMTRCLAYLFGAGAMLALLTLPKSSSASAVGILISQTGYALAAVMLLTILLVNFSRLPLWTFQFTLAAGTGLISFVIYTSGENSSAYTMFYLWIVLYAFYFFRMPQAVAQLFLVGLAYGAVLHFKEEIVAPGTRWLIAVATLAVAGILIALLKNRVETLVTRLSQTARTDPLTGLLNRRGFDESFESELERARRSGQPLGVVLLDLDHFKAVNDNFGHEMGDDALQRVSGAVRATKRRIDSAARFGGEEFALLLPYSDVEGSAVMSERIRKQVLDAFQGEPYELTVSLGVASFPTDGLTPEDLLRAADRALYTAKRQGRNRSVVHARAYDLESRPEPQPLRLADAGPRSSAPAATSGNG